jgi:hypothetical protein
MQTFELLGSDEDETRLLRAPAVGYSIALAGHPRLAPHWAWQCTWALGNIGYGVDKR